MSFTDTLATNVDSCDTKGWNLCRVDSPNYLRMFNTSVIDIGYDKRNPERRAPFQRFKFSQPIDRFCFSLTQMTPELVDGSNREGQCPGFELEFRIGQVAWMMSKPLCIVQFQPELLYETTDQTNGPGPYEFNGFLIELNGRIGNGVDIYARPLDNPNTPGTARRISLQVGVIAERGGLDPSLQLIRNPDEPTASVVIFSALPVIPVTPP